MTDMVAFDRNKLKQLKAAYKVAVECKAEFFVFDHRVLLVRYAKYMIEYLETQFKRRGKRD